MSSVSWCFEEARRRFESFAMRDHKPLDKAWLGLGSPTQYKPAVKAGFMRPLNERETPRALNWYLLTPAGVERYRELFPGSEDGTARKYKDGSPIREDA